MTAKDIADVTLDSCTNDGISYEKEQKHVVMPAMGQSTPAEQQFR